MNSLYSAHFVALLVATACLAAPENNEDGTANRKCLDTSRHKASPSQERLYKTKLYGLSVYLGKKKTDVFKPHHQSLTELTSIKADLGKECNVYDELSCCKNETAFRVHKGDLYDFTKLLCKNKDLSPECKKFFLKDACFYECSPHLGPWIVRDDDRNTDRLKNVPLCKSDCDNWFAACAHEFTCSTNWKADHDKKDFTCKAAEKCQTIKEKFQTAESFCKKVWDDSYDVIDGDNCMNIDTTSTKEAKNNESVVNKEKNSGSSITYNFILVSLPLLVSLRTLSNNSV